MKEVLFNILQSVLTAVIPLLIGFLVLFIKKKTAQVAAQIDNETAKRYLNEAANAVTTAVTATSQTYVDALKKTNAFTAEAQLEALNKAKDTALAIMTPAARDFLNNLYGDANKYLEAKIEEAVKVQKNSEGILIPAVLEEKTEE